MFRFSRLLFTQ